MRRPALLVALGAVLLLVFLLVLWPARVAVDWFAPDGVTLTGVTGTVWQGAASQATLENQPLGELRWDARRLGFLLARPTWDIELRRPGGSARFRAEVTGGQSVRIRDLAVAVTLAELEQFVSLYGTQGNLTVQLAVLRLEDGLLTELAGRAGLESVRPAGLDTDLGAFELEIPADQSAPFTGSIAAVSGPLTIADGTLEVQADGNYVARGRVAAGDGAPDEIRQGLQFVLGAPDGDGYHAFMQRGSL